MAKDQLGKFGVWQAYSTATPQGVREIEELGYGTVWLGASPPATWDGFDALFESSNTITIATSIINIWASPAKDAAETYHRLEAKYPGRFLLGVGAGHPENDGTYTKPYDALVTYLDDLDTAGVPKNRRALAALGPKVAQLAADRTAGALPYLTTPAHTASVRTQLGPEPLIAPEHKIVFDENPTRARTTAHDITRFYLGLSNYVNNLRRYGFTPEDLTAPGSDHLVDALVAHGTPTQITELVTAHLRSGADHIAIQILGTPDPLPALRALAPLLAQRANNA